MKKIRAYTILEVTVAMLLSAICISICYTAYGIIATYYTKFQQKNESADAVLSMKQVLCKDIAKATVLLQLRDGMLCQSDSTRVSYLFEDDYILRQVDPGRIDTLKVAVSDLYMVFEGVEVSEADTVDLVKFKVELPNQAKIPMVFSKHYSSQNLFH